ncbi:MAG: TOBE domain-containing protein, partial [Gibbsiella quercinecans]|uniref:TOBE domain-containing protein n=1 Tax=Gibbsiella quercinecans TaxID=929813 RepID=UPI003F40686A
VQMRLELQQLHRRLKTTSLYVTHDQVEAMTLAQRVIVMNKGVAEQIGTPSEVYQRPASLFVASFIGSPAMNLLPGTVSINGQQVQLADGTLLPLPQARPEWSGRQLTLGIRPEHIQLTTHEQGGLPLVMQTLELLGADNLAHGQWGGNGVIARLSHETMPSVGSTLYVQLPAQALHFFDTHSGLRIE